MTSVSGAIECNLQGVLSNVRAIALNPDTTLPGLPQELAVPLQGGSVRPRVSTIATGATSAAASGTSATQNSTRISAALEPPVMAETSPITNGPPAGSRRPRL